MFGSKSEQHWFWSERWQQMEREADADIAAGRERSYDDLDGFMDDLEAMDWGTESPSHSS
jgi:antitoxin MazE